MTAEERLKRAEFVHSSKEKGNIFTAFKCLTGVRRKTELKLQNHRITEWLGLERSFSSYLVQPLFTDIFSKV